MSSLKSKILEKAVKHEDNFYYSEASGILTLETVLGLLDEVTKQIQDKLKFYREQFEQAEGFFSTPYGAKIEALEWILVVLDGEKSTSHGGLEDEG